MRPFIWFLISTVLFIGSESLLAYQGYVRVFFVLFVPVFVSSSPISFAPLLFFLIPVLISLKENSGDRPYQYHGNMAETSKPKTQRESKIGGFVMIGPIPILFGKGMSGRVLIALAVIMLALIISWIILTK